MPEESFLGLKSQLSENIHTIFNKLACSEGAEWKEQRRFTLRVLKDFGLGKSSMESLIHEEVDAFNDSLKQQCGTPVDTRHRFNISGTPVP